MLSLDSQLCRMAFCWGRHVREHVAEADTGERTHNEGFFTNNTHIIESPYILWLSSICYDSTERKAPAMEAHNLRKSFFRACTVLDAVGYGNAALHCGLSSPTSRIGPPQFLLLPSPARHPGFPCPGVSDRVSLCVPGCCRILLPLQCSGSGLTPSP